jgi:glycosyltransferase involved in cell wall biosynthesis
MAKHTAELAEGVSIPRVPARHEGQQMLKISVIIPTHNRATLLRGAMDSVLRQTYPVHELVIVDDGSIDCTKQVVSEYQSTGGEANTSVRYVYQEQQGVSVARNTGIAEASGDWIAFLDSDDTWLPEKLEWQVRALQKFSDISAACVTDSTYINNPLLNKTAFEQVGARCDSPIGVFPHFARRITSHTFHGAYLQTLIARSEVVRALGGFHPSLPVNEDTDFFFHLAQRTNICYVNMPLVQIDRAPGRAIGLTELRTKENYRLEMAQFMYEKWLKEEREWDPIIDKEIRRRLQEIHVGWASVHLMDGDSVRALQSLSLAMQYAFTGKPAFKWLLTKMAPEFTRRILLKRREKAPPPLL